MARALFNWRRYSLPAEAGTEIGAAERPKTLRSSTLSRVLAALGLSIIVGAVVFAAFFVISLRDLELKAIRNRLEVPAQALAHVLQSVARNTDLTLRDIQTAIARDAGDTTTSRNLRKILIDNVSSRSAATGKIEIYDAAGRAIVSSQSDPPPQISVAAYEFFQRQMAAGNDQLTISKLVADPLTGEPALIASRPFRDSDGNVRGVIAAYLDIGHIQRVLDSLNMPPGTAIVLFTREGAHLLRNPPIALGDKLLDVDFSQRPTFLAFRDSGPEGAFQEFMTLAAGVSRFVAGVGTLDSPFVITAGWDSSAALAHWRSEAIVIAVFTLAGIAVIACLFLYILTESRRKDELLVTVSRSDERSRALMAALPDAVMIIEPSLKINFANPAAEDLYGYEPGGMNGLALGRLMASTIRSDDERAMQGTFKNWDASFQIRGMERVALRRDGSEFPVEISARPYESPAGRMLVSVVRDVSKRQTNDRALHRSRENLAKAQRVAGVGSFEIDLITGERDWSDEFLRIWGIAARPTDGEVNLLTNLVHPDDREKFGQGRKAVLEGNPLPLSDFRIIRPDGSERILHNEYSADFDENGRPIRLFGTVQDVTERKNIEIELRRSRENLARAQRIAGVGSFERNLVTGDVDLSDELYRIHGVVRGSPQAKLEILRTLVHPEDRQKIEGFRRAAERGEDAPAIDYRIVRPDGVERVLHRECDTLFDESGKPVVLFGTLQDITERKQIEVELRRSRENLDRAQRIAGVGSFDHNLISNEIVWSDELYHLYGLTPGAARAGLETALPFVHADDREKFLAIRHQAAQGVRTSSTDFRIIRSDGVERIFHRECDVTVDESGRAIRMFGTLQDITERKRAELELFRSRENLARAQQIAAVGSFDRDLIAGTTEWSDEFVRIWGIAADHKRGAAEQLLALVHPEDRQKFIATRDDALEGKPSSADFRIIRPDGKERVIHREYGVLFDEKGKPVRSFGTVQDITDRKKIETELRQSRENLARAQRLAGIGSFERDLITGEGEWSDEFMRIWGLEHIPQGKLRNVLMPLVHPEDRQKFHEAREAALHNAQIPPVDFRITRPDGQERILHPEFKVIFDENGKAVRMFGTVQDITERKTIEVELRRSRENLARAQRIAGIGSFERDLITGKLEWSDEFLRIWGVTNRPSHGTAEILLSLVHPEDRQKFMEGRDAALGRKTTSSLDFRIIRPDGVERVLHRDYGVLFNDAGKAVRMFGTVQDVTERKKIELEMHRSRENLARAQRIAATGSFEQDLITGHAEWSDEMHRILGHEQGTLAPGPDTLADLIHPDDREIFWAARRIEASGKSGPPIEFRICRSDGSERVVRRESDVICDGEGRPIRLYGTFADITERRKAEIDMHRSRENLARAQRIAGMGSFERDLLTNQAEWSDEMYHVLGIEKTASVPTSETLINLVHPDDREKFAAHRLSEIAGQAGKPFEYRILRPDGAERVVRRETAVGFDDEKRPIRLYGTLQDITERRLAERRERELERQLLHSQKLEALGTLAGGIAHDLNNTLVPIMALSKLTARRFQAGTLVRANLDTIYEASARARDLVKRVVAFSRKDESEKRDTNIAEIVDEALKLLRATIPSSITLETRIGTVPAIPADASQLHQVVTNLVSNASQAIDGEIGTITVTLDLVTALTGEREIRLSVKDTGMGMDEATQQRIFEPFFTTKAVGQGTGLGLSIVHGIIAGHGGHIEVKSEPGKGTQLDLYFPVATADQGPITSSRPAA